MNSNPPTPQTQDIDTQSARDFSYTRWRETFIKSVLRGATVLGTLLIIISIPTTDPTRLSIYFGALILLAVSAFLPIPYTLRALLLLAIVYGLGTLIILSWGWNVDGSLFMAAFSILAALLFDYRAGLFGIILSALTIMAVGWQVVNGNLVLDSETAIPGSIMSWIGYTLDMVAVSIVINFAIYLLKREFNTLLAQVRGIVSSLDRERASLEDRVRERTAELSRRSAQLESSAFVSRQAAAIQDTGTLISEVVRLITDRFGYYHTGLFLADETQRYVTLIAASSEGGKRMLQRGHRLEIGREGVVGYAAFEKRPRIALDVGLEAVYFNNPDLPETRSEIALPLLVRNRLIGVLDIQARESQGFSNEDISTFQSMADQIALAIENARLIAESQLAIGQLQDLSSDTSYAAWKEFLGRQVKGFSYSPLGITPLSEDYPDTPDPSDDSIRLPIVLRGKKIGAIQLRQKAKDTPWGLREQNLVQDVATQVGLALENARLLEQSQKQAVREQSINTITSRLSQALDIDSLLQTAVKELHQLPNVAEVSVFLGSNQKGKS